MKHPHWEFLAYDEISDKGEMRFATEITVIDQPLEALALEQAKKMVIRKNYYLRKVWECNTCATQEEQVKTLKKFEKFIEKHDD